MYEWNLKQWINIKFYFEITKSFSETVPYLKWLMGEHAMKKLGAFVWLDRFKERWEYVHDGASKKQVLNIFPVLTLSFHKVHIFTWNITLKVTVANSDEISKFCFHGIIPWIILPYVIFYFVMKRHLKAL